MARSQAIVLIAAMGAVLAAAVPDLLQGAASVAVRTSLVPADPSGTGPFGDVRRG